MNIEGYNGTTLTGVKVDAEGVVLVKQSTAKYEHSVSEGNVFTGANLLGTPVTTQAGLSATTPALTLYNPVGSGVNLVLLTVTVDITTSPAAASGLCLAYNLKNATPPATTTAATVVSNIIGNTAAPQGQCYRIATLAAAPVAFRFLGGTTGAAAIGGVQLIDHIDGEIIIPEGVAISIQASSATALVASYSWKEVEI